MIHANVEAYNLLRNAILGLFFNRDVHQDVQLIYEKESTSDVLERALVRDIYDTDLDLAEKNLLKDTVINIGNISAFGASHERQAHSCHYKKKNVPICSG